MILSLLKKIHLDVWYRGNRIIKPKKILDNSITFTNNDIIDYYPDNHTLYINDNVVAKIADLTADEAYELYIMDLENRGYKIL